MQLLLLGPVQASVAGQAINVGVRKQRLVLCVLALEANRQVPAGRLVELLWPEGSPASARGMIHSYISGLRAVLTKTGARKAGVWVERDGSGYVLRCAPEHIDVHRFRRLVAHAQRGNDEQRMATLEQALALWRGPALTGTADDALRARLFHGLEEARLGAIEDLFETRLRLGHWEGLVDELLVATRDHPDRPRLTGALMLALHQAGRSAEALETYRRTHERLSQELGIDPPVQLQKLQLAILRNDHVSALATLPTQPNDPELAVVPRQLPPRLATFTGRSGELDQILNMHSESSAASTVVVTAVDGMAGVGKTALAVHAAHQLADQFRDGLLFVDLRGFTPGLPPTDPGDVLNQLLRGLGISSERVPSELDARTALYRSILAGKRMLILLDNAADEAQVQPLLPGASGCLVLITSRRRLAGLDDARLVSLDVLSLAEAIALFIRVTGVDHPSEVVEEIVTLCGQLPLAIRIAAARLKSRPKWTLRHLAERLRDHQNRLNELEVGQRSITATIDVSYDQLTADQQRMFRLLALHPGPDIDTHAAAALTATTADRALRLLDGLLDVHLIQQHYPDRYRFHDLVRAHAAHTAAREETQPDQQAASTRMLDYYAHTATAAMDLAYPHETHQRPRPPKSDDQRPSIPGLPFSSDQQAMAWLDTELTNLLAVAEHAATHGPQGHTVHLSATLHRHLYTRLHYDQAQILHTHALQIVRTIADPIGEIAACNGLGRIHKAQGTRQVRTRYKLSSTGHGPCPQGW